MSKRKIKTHGKSDTYEHRVWSGMINRCYCKTSGSYKNYGARGITVCDRWLKFENFLNDMGLAPPNTQLDRIKNDEGYSKENCKWSDRKVQCRNRRTSRFVTYKDQTFTVSEWAEKLKIPRATLDRRILKYGWSIDKAFTTPVLTKEQVSVIGNNKRWNGVK